jgi:hypothetical protein
VVTLATTAEAQSDSFLSRTWNAIIQLFSPTSTASGFQTQDISTCRTITTSGLHTLDNDITGVQTCINITVNDVVLDCNNFKISISSLLQYGSLINATKVNNVTVMNCNLNASQRYTFAIDMGSVSNLTIINNRITISGNQARALDLNDLNDSLIDDNIITNTGNTETAVVIVSGAIRTTISNNSLYSTNAGSSTGIQFTEVAGNRENRIAGNNVTMSLSSGNIPKGITMTTGHNVTIVDNFVRLTAGSSGAAGITTSNTEGNLTNNTVLMDAPGYNCYGLQLSTSRLRVVNNNLSGTQAAVYDPGGTTPSLFINNTLYTGITGNMWYYGTGPPGNDTFLNTTLAIPRAGLKVPYFTSNGANLLLYNSDIVVNNRSVYVNTATRPQFNTSSIVRFTNVFFTDPRIMVDYNENHSRVPCPPSLCTVRTIDMDAGIIEFNVSHFTTYSVQDGLYGTIYESTTMTQDIECEDTCFNIAAPNVVLDCAGHTMNYSQRTTGNGVTVLGVDNAVIKNCNILNSPGKSLAHAINITSSNYTQVIDNNITIYGHTSAAGDYIYGIVMGRSNFNTLSRNNIVSRAMAGQCMGLMFFDGMQNNEISHNNITTISIASGSGNSYGIYLWGANISNNDIADNTVNSTGTDGWNMAVFLQQIGGPVRNNTVRGNRLTVNGTSASQYNYAVSLTGVDVNNSVIDNEISASAPSDHATGVVITNTGAGVLVAHNHISAVGSSFTNYGLSISNSANNTIFNNTIRTGGTLDNYGMSITNSPYNHIIGNDIRTSGSGNTNFGIYTENNTQIANNTIITAGGINNHGIYLNRAACNITNNSIRTSGTGTSHPFYLSAANNSKLAGNNGTCADTGCYDVYITGGSAGVEVNSTRIESTFNWMYATTAASFNDITFSLNGTSVHYASLTPTSSFDMPKTALQLGRIFAYVNSTAKSWLNRSADITFTRYYKYNPQILVNFNDNTGLNPCPADVCTISYSDPDTGILSFNVSHFTNFTVQGDAILISGIDVYNTTNQTASINWTTTPAGNTTFNYGTTTALGTKAYNTSFLTYHNLNLTGLQNNTQYFYNITACDSAYNCSTVGPYSFTTQNNTRPPPTINDIGTHDTTNQTTNINWTTTPATNTTIDYGTDPDNLASTVYNTSFLTYHDINLTGLQNNTQYYYNITSCTSDNICTTEGPNSFTTQNNTMPISHPPNITSITAQSTNPATNDSRQNITRTIGAIVDNVPTTYTTYTNWVINGNKTKILELPFDAEEGLENEMTSDAALNHNGSINGGVNWTSNGGHDGKGAYEWTQTGGERIVVDQPDSLDINHITVDIWFKTTASEGHPQKGLFSKHDGGNSWFLSMDNPGRCTNSTGAPQSAIVWYHSGQSVCTPFDLDDGQWHHLIATKTNQKLAVYVDRKNNSDILLTSISDTASANPVEIGNSPNTDIPWNGTIDHPIILLCCITIPRL